MQVRSLKTNKAKAVIVAHNVERIESENGLDDVVAQLMQLSRHRQEWVLDECPFRKATLAAADRGVQSARLEAVKLSLRWTLQTAQPQ